MTNDNTIYFVTTNGTKFTYLKKQLNPLGVQLKRLNYELEEGRSLDIETITEAKLKQAKLAFPGKKIIVDDRGFFIPILNGFPGPFVKLMLSSFGIDGLLKLMVGHTDRRAVFSSGIGYFDGNTDKIITTNEVGRIVEQPRGDNLRGWTTILRIYSHPSSPDKTLAEMDDDEWDRYSELIAETDPFAVFAKYLSTAKLTDK